MILLLTILSLLLQRQNLTLALVDPYPWHSEKMIAVAHEENAQLTLYDSGIASGLTQAYLDRQQVVVVSSTLPCHSVYDHLLKLLSTTSQVYIPGGDYRHVATGTQNCVRYKDWTTIVSGLDNGQKPHWLIHENVELWIECEIDVCSSSEAVMRAGARAANGVKP